MKKSNPCFPGAASSPAEAQPGCQLPNDPAKQRQCWGTSEGWTHPGHPYLSGQSWITMQRLRGLRCFAISSPCISLPS